MYHRKQSKAARQRREADKYCSSLSRFVSHIPGGRICRADIGLISQSPTG